MDYTNTPQDGQAALHPSNAAITYYTLLSMENIKCFGSKQELRLSRADGRPAQWSIIFGLNGTGKTTILQSIAGFENVPAYNRRERLFPRLLSVNGMHHFPSVLLRTTTRAGAIAATISLSKSLSASPDQFAQMQAEVGDNSVHCSFQPTLTLHCGYGAGRRVGESSLSDTVTVDDSCASIYSDKAELRNPEEWLLRLDYSATKSDRSKDASRHLKTAKDLLLGVLPDVDDLRFVNPTGPNPKPRVEFKTFSGWVPLRQLGYGYQTLITWVADLVSRMVERYPDSPNPLAEPAVVLVDEIDLHLHPVWQRKLMGYLTERFPNTQFIATAHSPLVAQAAADANLAVLRREGDHVVIDNDVDDIRNWRIDQILTSDLFGLETARPPRIEAALRELRALQTKAKRSKADERRVRELEAEIGDLPTGESKQEIEERKHIRETLDRLLKERKPAP